MNIWVYVDFFCTESTERNTNDKKWYFFQIQQNCETDGVKLNRSLNKPFHPSGSGAFKQMPAKSEVGNIHFIYFFGIDATDIICKGGGYFHDDIKF